jgi:hypothetical protein
MEALSCKVPVAAKQALLMLLDSFTTQPGASDQHAAGYEAVIFQNLIKLILVSCCLLLTVSSGAAA